MRLARSHPAERMEAACRRALVYGTLSYRSIQSILSTGVDQLAIELEPQPIRLPADHVHLRGADYYRTLDHPATTGD